MMKTRILSLLAALGLVLGLAGCTISTPDSVGTIGEVSISSGMYLLSQYQAYTAARNYASDDQQDLSVKDFLKETITITDDETGESKDWLVSDYVADETRRNLQYYAAVKTRFAALGGQLTQEEIDAADSTAQQIWDANQDLYAANGFGLATIQEYEYTLTMSDDLLELVYGPEGETPVSDEDLTSYVENDMVYGYYASVPLYNTETYASDEELATEAKSYVQAAVDAYNTLAAASGSDSNTTIYANLYTALSDNLPGAYTAFDNTYTADNLVNASFFTDTVLSSYYTAEQGDAIRAAAVGEAVLLDQSSYSCEVFVRAWPLENNTLDDVRDIALQDMKGTELQDALFAYGADELADGLDSGAMAKMPASRIVTSVSDS